MWKIDPIFFGSLGMGDSSHGSTHRASARSLEMPSRIFGCVWKKGGGAGGGLSGHNTETLAPFKYKFILKISKKE